MEQSQQEFCAALKAARERRGLKLTDIAEVTKVCPSYFSALERNDLRVWPKGLFRRSFFRGYVSTIGLPVEPTLEEFIRLFPEDERTAVVPAAASDQRLTLDESWTGARPPVMARLCAAVLDALAIAAITAGVAWSASLPIDLTFAVVAMTYFLLATVVIAETPARFFLRRGAHLAAMIRSIFAPGAATPTDEAATEEDDRTWISDARRVRPRGQAPGLRVRFKVSS